MKGDELLDAEAQDRATWKTLLAQHGLEPMADVEDRDFVPRVMETVRRDKRRRVFLWMRSSIVAGVAACIAIALLGRIAVIDGKNTDGESAVAGKSRLMPAEIANDDAFKPARAALAVLELIRSDAGADKVKSAVATLEKMQNADGSFGNEGGHSLYNHAFAAFALIEAAMLENSGVTPAIAKSIAYSESAQNEYALWDYAPGGCGNDALSVWQLGILAAACDIGWQDSKGTLRRGLAALSRNAQGEIFDYRMAFGRESDTAMGNLVLTTLATHSLARFSERFPQGRLLADTLLASLDAASPPGGQGSARASGNLSLGQNIAKDDNILIAIRRLLQSRAY